MISSKDKPQKELQRDNVGPDFLNHPTNRKKALATQRNQKPFQGYFLESLKESSLKCPFQITPMKSISTQRILNKKKNLTHKIYSIHKSQVFYSRGYHGKSNIEGTKIEIPKKPKKRARAYEKRKAKEKFRDEQALNQSSAI